MKKVLIALIFVFGLTAQDLEKIGTGTMRVGVNASMSGLGFGFGGSFEFGITDQIGAQLNIATNSYDVGTTSWSILPIDLYGTYHTKAISFGDGGYYMAGVSLVNMSYDDESGSQLFFGFGYGTLFKLGDKLTGFGEARYRIGTFEINSGDGFTAAWYSVAAGVTYDLN
jgi:hypothetical protein